jgi:HAD superfamily hydrolase (TIGR01509 family)
MIEIVLLDFNGVIINDEPIHFQAYRKTFEPEGLNITQEEYDASFGMNDRALIRAAYARAGIALDTDKLEALVARKTDIYKELLAGEVPLFPGVETFIKGLRRHFGVGLVSMAQRVEIDHVLARVGLADAFDAIVSADDVDSHKPDPACYLLGRERTAHAIHKKGNPTPPPQSCAVIEDTPAGVQAGVNAKMRVIGLANTVPPAALRAAGAEAVFHTLADCNATASASARSFNWARVRWSCPQTTASASGFS